jgi:plastocyanin domain-containing protein
LTGEFFKQQQHCYDVCLILDTKIHKNPTASQETSISLGEILEAREAFVTGTAAAVGWPSHRDGNV